MTPADKVTLFTTPSSVYQLDKVSFFTLIRQKSVTCSDNAPTVAPDKVPGNRRLRAGSFLREQPGTHGSAPVLTHGAPLPGHSLEKLPAHSPWFQGTLSGATVGALSEKVTDF